MTNCYAVVLGLLFFSLATQTALAKKETEEVVALRPIVSSAGLKRLEDNLAVLAGNIKDTEANISACDKNKNVIANELKELEKLEKEQVALANSYDAYLKNANVQMTKNEERTVEVAKWEAANKTRLEALKGEHIPQELLEKVAAARQDKLNREKWKVDADSKIARVRKLQEAGKQNLKDIEARRSPLRDQVGAWATKGSEFRKVLTELTARKVEFDKLVEAKKKDIPTDTEDK